MVLASDGESSYAFFLYDDLQWSQADLRSSGSTSGSGSDIFGSGANEGSGSGASGSGASDPSSRYVCTVQCECSFGMCYSPMLLL